MDYRKKFVVEAGSEVRLHRVDPGYKVLGVALPLVVAELGTQVRTIGLMGAALD